MGAADPDTPTTYSFTWSPPQEENGGVVMYLLTCAPTGSQNETSVMSAEFQPPSTSGALSGLSFNIPYQCTVQARNMAALSQPSNTVAFTISESS